MKKLLLVAFAFAVYAAFKKISLNQPAAVPSAQVPPVDDLAHKLQDAWADHHTVV